MARFLANTDPALRRCWHPVALGADVGDEPVSVRVFDEDYVLARMDGGVSVFADRCPHRLAPLSAGWVERDGAGPDRLRCGYHGWCFAADGTCVDIPAIAGTDRVPPKAHLRPTARVAEHDGMIFLAPEEPLTDVLTVPEAFGPGFRSGFLGPVRASVGAGLMIDNFLDMAHFPFVHAKTIGTDDEVTFELEIERDGLGMVVRSEHLFPNREDRAVATGERPLLQKRRLTYTYRAPFSVCLRIDYVEAGGTNILSFHVLPEDDTTCRLFTLVARNDMESDDALGDAIEFERTVVEEDLALQERYRDKRLPLDLTTEVHVKVDRVTVELRRILGDLVDAASA
jgi:phenylpropionate dioxygenase-like ring-hydroxylating dioxygenase large terminal subunit